MKALFDSFKSADERPTFIGIKNYTSKKSGKNSDINLLIGVSTMNAKVRDLAKLRNVTESDLATFALDKGIKLEIFKMAHAELIESAEKNTLSDFCFWIKKQENQATKIKQFAKKTGIDIATVLITIEKSKTEQIATNASQAQTDAYIHLTNGLKLHKETMNVHVYGFFQSEKVNPDQPGEFKSVASRDKTIAKDYISKQAKFRMLKYRQYDLGNIDQIKIEGTTLQIL